MTRWMWISLFSLGFLALTQQPEFLFADAREQHSAQHIEAVDGRFLRLQASASGGVIINEVLYDPEQFDDESPPPR